MKNLFITWLFCLLWVSCTSSVTHLDLSGQWTVRLDSSDTGIKSPGAESFMTLTSVFPEQRMKPAWELKTHCNRLYKSPNYFTSHVNTAI